MNTPDVVYVVVDNAGEPCDVCKTQKRAELMASYADGFGHRFQSAPYTVVTYVKKTGE